MLDLAQTEAYSLAMIRSDPTHEGIEVQSLSERLKRGLGNVGFAALMIPAGIMMGWDTFKDYLESYTH